MFKNITKIGLIGLTAFLLFSCTKEENIIGDNLIDSGGFKTNFVDTFALNTSFKVKDSIITTNSGTAIIGNINDPVFGETKATLFTEFVPLKTQIDFGTVTADSIFIELPYIDSYGDLDAEQEFSVYQLTEKIDTAKKYHFEEYGYSNQIATHTFKPNVSTTEDDKKSFLKLRIPLSTSFGQEILDQEPGGVLKDAESFKEYFKGLAIVPTKNFSSTDGNILSFNYNNIKIWLYYSDANNKKDSIDFVTGSGSKKLNNYKHNYSTSSIKDLLTQENTEKLYIQGMSGIETIVSIKDLDAITKSLGKNTVINRANIKVFMDTDTLENFPNHGGFNINHFIDYNGDMVYQNTIDLGSNLAPLNKEENVYNIDVTRYLQNAIKTGEAKDLYLRVNPVTSIRRSILEGVNTPNTESKMKLEILYSTEN